MTDKNELDLLFDEWKETPNNDPLIKHRVWMHIAGDYSRSNARFPRPVEALFGFLSKPLGATAFIAASVVFGLLIAELRVSSGNSIRIEELAQTYIQLIDLPEASTNEGDQK